MPTLVTSILRSGVTAAGVYPTLAAWKASLPASLITADENHILNVEAVAGGYNEALSLTTSIATDPTRAILIQPAAGHGHIGVYDTSKALIVLPATTGAMTLQAANVTIRGMQIQQSGMTTGVTGVLISALVALPATNLITLEGCIFKGSASGSFSGGSGLGYMVNVLDNTTGNLRRALVRANLFVDIYNATYPTTTGVVALRAEKGRLWAYNNTIYNCSRGIVTLNTSTTTTVYLKNNLVACKQSLTGRTDYAVVAATIDASSTYNASSDATAPGTSPRINQTFTFMGSGDYHLAPGDLGALGLGADLSADADFPATLDIDGQTFSAPWSIGSDSAVVVSNSLTLSTPVAGRIYQSVAGVADIAVTGVYAGTLTAIKARLVLDGTSTPVTGFDWATVVASPTGDAFSFTFTNVPRGAGWYAIQVQDTVDSSITATGGKVGVGELIGVIGQSNVGSFIGNGSYASSDLVRGYGESWAPWQTVSSEGAGSMATALATAIGCPVGVVVDYTSGTTIATWISTLYTPALAVFNSVGGKLGGLVFIQGEADWDGTTYATYLAGLGTLFDTKFRTDLGQPNLPVVIVANGRYTSGTGSDTSTYGQIKQAHYEYGTSGTHNYVVDRIDAALSDGLHMTIAGALGTGQRAGQALKVDYGYATEYRGPYMASVASVNATTFDVNIVHRLGTNFTPASGITGFKAFDPGAGGAEIVVSTAVQTTATQIRLVLASAPVAMPSITYADGYNPIVTALARDNSTLAIPLEWNAGVTAVAAIDALTGQAISTGAPTLSTPAIGQVHGLSAQAITTGAPTIAQPTLTSAANVNALTAQDITAGPPTTSIGVFAVSGVQIVPPAPTPTSTPTIQAPRVPFTSLTPITPPRVALIDPRTGLIDRAWYMFFLSLNNAATAVVDSDTGTNTDSLLASYDAALQTLAQEVQAQPSIDTSNVELEKKIDSLLALPPLQVGTMAALQQDNVPYFVMDTSPIPPPVPPVPGAMWWNASGTLNLKMGNNNITQQVGEEFFQYGKASAAISDVNLQLVYKTGVVGASGVITFAPTVAGITDTDLIIGIATEPLAINAFGRVTTLGTVNGINTTGSVYGEVWANNDDIWYNPVTGGLTKIKPVAPNIKQQVGTIINAGPGGSGSFYVKIAGSSILGGTDANVQLGTLVSGDSLVYDSALGYWLNKQASALTGVPITKTANFTVAPGETWFINNKTGSACTITLPSAATFPGREISIKNLQAFAVNSASSNVAPIDSATTGTAILLPVVGNWATMVSDGTNWVIMQQAPNNILLLE